MNHRDDAQRIVAAVASTLGHDCGVCGGGKRCPDVEEAETSVAQLLLLADLRWRMEAADRWAARQLRPSLLARLRSYAMRTGRDAP